MSSKRCCVPQCPEIKDSKLHLFPNPEKDIDRFRTWVHIIGGEILSHSNENIYKLRRVCHAHFEEKYCCRFKRISNIAIPTLLLPGQTTLRWNIKTSQSKQVAATSFFNQTKQDIPSEKVTTTQPDGDKQVLNYTLTHCDELKQSRLDQSQQVANKTFTQAAHTSLNVAITCDRRGGITQGESDQVLYAIQKQIMIEACSPIQDTPGPNFNQNPLYVDGVLKLWCGNEHTLEWLKKTISSLALPNNTSLVVKNQLESQKWIRCRISLTDDQGIYEDPIVIGQVLRYQNPWIEVKRWIILHAEKQRSSWFVVLSIPEDHVLTLISSGRRLSLGLGSVEVKFLGPNGKFVEFPQGWDPVKRQLVDVETMTLPNDPEAIEADAARELESIAPPAVGNDPSSDGKLNGIHPPASNPGGNFDNGVQFVGL